MRTRNYLWAAAAIATAGVAFSGYLSAVRYASGVCALNDPCPFFLGYPACYTGFALFASLFVATGLALVVRARGRWPMCLNLAIATAGVLFAGRLTVMELVAPVHPDYAMGLPTCAYGFVFFAAMLVLSAVARWRRPGTRGHWTHLPVLDGK
jgi:uncharacterized membrane protein